MLTTRVVLASLIVTLIAITTMTSAIPVASEEVGKKAGTKTPQQYAAEKASSEELEESFEESSGALPFDVNDTEDENSKDSESSEENKSETKPTSDEESDEFKKRTKRHVAAQLAGLIRQNQFAKRHHQARLPKDDV